MKELFKNPKVIIASLVVLACLVFLFYYWSSHRIAKSRMVAVRDGVQVWNEDRSGISKIAKENEWCGGMTGEDGDYYKGLNSIGKVIYVLKSDVKLEKLSV